MPGNWLNFAIPRVKASPEEIARSLEGNWRAELLFVLQQELEMYDTYQMRSHTYLGAQYRRLRTRVGAPKAITAMAHRLARLGYRMLKYRAKLHRQRQ